MEVADLTSERVVNMRSIRSMLADPVVGLRADGFSKSGPSAWDRPLGDGSHGAVVRISVYSETDWPSTRGMLRAGVVIPKVIELNPDYVAPKDHAGLVKVNLSALVRGDLSGSNRDFDVANFAKRGLFGRVTDVGEVEARALDEMITQVRAGRDWLAQFRGVDDVERYLADRLEADKRGGWTMGWLDLGALRWILNDHAGAEIAWERAVHQRPMYAALKRDIRSLRKSLEQLDRGESA